MLAANSFEASFVDAAIKQGWLAQLNQVFAAG
jgi:adenosine deaminase